MLDELADSELVLLFIPADTSFFVLSSSIFRLFCDDATFFSLLLLGKQLKKAEDIDTLSNIPITYYIANEEKQKRE